MRKTLPLTAHPRFWFYHLVYWLGYLLLKFIHLVPLKALEDDAFSWPLLFSYSGVVLCNLLLTGVLAWQFPQQRSQMSDAVSWLLRWLLPWSLVMVVLRYVLLNIWLLPESQTDARVALFSTYLLVALPLAGWMAGFLLFLSNQRYQQQIRQEQQLLSQARAARLKILRYQLDPHFMFNTLNALNALIVNRQDQQIELLIEQLSVFLRHSLQEQPDQQVPLQQELQALQAYFAIQQHRFGERLQLDWQQAALPSLKLPPLLLQPLAEFAMKSTVTEQTGQIQLQFCVCCLEDVLQFSLLSGPVATAVTQATLVSMVEAEWPDALKQLNERLQLLFGVHSQLQLQSGQGMIKSGFCLPLEALDVRT